jgi:hypothetical protein
VERDIIGVGGRWNGTQTNYGRWNRTEVLINILMSQRNKIASDYLSLIPSFLPPFERIENGRSSSLRTGVELTTNGGDAEPPHGPV